MRVKDDFIEVLGGSNRASKIPILAVAREQRDRERVRFLG